jgi:4-amino-4-deoxy-L-arabinose transferase-like glycosyltransferase
MLIPLVLSAYTHLWNPMGFPMFHPDEGVYLRRSMHVLAGLGPQDPDSRFDHSQDSTSSYDHPYFGQMLLAGIFSIIGYPDSKPVSDSNSIEYYFTVPRIIMGLFSIIDTFLIFRICERRYNLAIAVAAAILFAVMPLSWLTRRIVLDSIQLPFVLLSILLLVEMGHRSKNTALLCLLSGICMGLSVFTKIPAIMLIPLGLYLIYGGLGSHGKRYKIKYIAIWLLPTILLPTIWPVYAISAGQFDEWANGVLWQGTQRQAEGRSLSDTLINFSQTDPVLLILGLAGIIFCSIRRDFLPIIWILPYFVLLYAVGWVTHFHLILVLPPFCMAIAKLLEGIPRFFKIKKSATVTTVALAVIALFGLFITTMVFTSNVSWTQLQAARLVENYTTQINKEGIRQPENVTIIASPVYSWLFKYVFDNPYTFSHLRDTREIETDKIVLVVDAVYQQIISGSEGENNSQVQRLEKINNDTNIISIFKSDWSGKRSAYPYTAMEAAGIRTRTSEIKANY